MFDRLLNMPLVTVTDLPNLDIHPIQQVSNIFLLNQAFQKIHQSLTVQPHLNFSRKKPNRNYKQFQLIKWNSLTVTKAVSQPLFF